MVKTELAYWLALKFIPRLANAKKIALVERYSLSGLFTPEIYSQLSLTDKQKLAIQQPNWSKINKILEQVDELGCHSISYQDVLYPEQLKQIYDPPLILFVQGYKNILTQAQLAIVGSRKATASGRETAVHFAQQLSEAGLIITSGLALGIDGAAHQGALKAKLPTIAVVATGLDIVYPARHKMLAQSILEYGGAIISEFLPNTPARAGHFPKRNRLISGLSLGVLLVEAEIKSGSLITARLALEQNREVFAIPSSIYNPMAAGCHYLIKQGAQLVENVDDIIGQLDFIRKPTHTNNNEEDKFKKIEHQDLFLDPLLASVGYEVTPVDIVVSRSQLSIDEVLTRLTMLELRGLVSSVPGGYLRLNRG